MHTRDSLIEDLKRSGIRPDDTLLVHSSMKKIGPVDGGAETVLDALMAYLKPGLLVFPTLSYNLNAEQPRFSVRDTPCIVGILPELFRRRPGVLRSAHPTHSIAAAGEGAADFVAGHETFDTPCARRSPWGKLLDRRGRILFVGTGIGCNTYLHGVEEFFGVPGMLTETRQPLVSVLADGREVAVPSRRHVGQHSHFFAKMEPLFAGQGGLTHVRLGDAECHLLDIPVITGITMRCLQEDPQLFTHDREPVLK